MSSGDHAAARSSSDEAIELAERLDDPICLTWAAHTAARHGLAGDGLPYASRAVDVARERALVTTLPLALQAQAAGLIAQSRFDLAYSTAEEGWRLALDIGQPWAASWNLAHLATLEALRGAEELVRAHVAELQALVGTSGAMSVKSHIGWALGLLDLGRGRPAEALDRLLVPVSTSARSPTRCSCSGCPTQSRPRLEPIGSTRSPTTSTGSELGAALPNPATPRTARALPRAGRRVRRRPALHAGDRARATRCHRSTARGAELLYGEWLRRHRRRVDARLHLRAALEMFQQLAATPWEARARSELRASGETARKRDPSTRDQLTPQELQISRLVACREDQP